ncbi:MAG: hypothetical protein ACK5LX_16745 [Oscillospiraceae bacterium]
MRHWNNRREDGGSLHALGNSKMAAYGEGPDLVQVFGPPYSAPSFLTLRVDSGLDLEVRTERLPGSAIYRHSLFSGGVIIGEMIDFVDAKLPVLVRSFWLTMGLTLRLGWGEAELLSSEEATASYLFQLAAGAYIYNDYPRLLPVTMALRAKGQAESRIVGGSEALLRLGPGEGAIILAGGEDYPSTLTNAEFALSAPDGELEKRTAADWACFTLARRDFSKQLPRELPGRERLLEAIDSVAVLIKAQQGREGGVLAGHNYHLFYVRDQYGVSRGMLALGCHEEARKILELYLETFRRYGRIHNAQGTPEQGIFHIHENDEVEITGYLLLQAFDYLRATGDRAFLRELFPMLEWAFRAQADNIIGGMLPFNGDETYIAGGLLPRTVMDDGSAEATLLFVTGGRQLVDFAGEEGLWSAEETEQAQDVLSLCEENWGGNFLPDGQIANQPARRALAEPPRFRHGVCLGCTAFGWTERSKRGAYLCRSCLDAGEEPDDDEKVYRLKSVSLMPLYIGAAQPDRELLSAAVTKMLAEYRATGVLPSRPDGDSCTGYDYGLLLYNLAKLGIRGDDVLLTMLDILDESGAWCEYYRENVPYGTRCRSWESGINIEAAIEYAFAWPEIRKHEKEQP